MQTTRRQFGKLASFAILSLASGSSILLTGCNAVTDLKNWIPVALAGLAGILRVLGITGNPIVTLIQAGFSALLAAITNYQAGSGVLADITNAITDIETQFASFFASVNIPANLLNIVEGLAGVILSTISAFAAQINPAAPAALSATVKVGQRTVPYTPKKRSVRQFKGDWNQICSSNGHPEIELK